jgi:hypothetical protein
MCTRYPALVNSTAKLDGGACGSYYVLFEILFPGALDLVEDDRDVVSKLVKVLCSGTDEVRADGLVSDVLRGRHDGRLSKDKRGTGQLKRRRT